MVRKQIFKWGRAAAWGLAAMAFLAGCGRGGTLTAVVKPGGKNGPVQSVTQVRQPEAIEYDDYKARRALEDENVLSD